jgi:hypothetical protein
MTPVSIFCIRCAQRHDFPKGNRFPYGKSRVEKESACLRLAALRRSVNEWSMLRVLRLGTNRHSGRSGLGAATLVAAFPAQAGIQGYTFGQCVLRDSPGALTARVAPGSPPARGTRTRVRFQQVRCRLSRQEASASRIPNDDCPKPPPPQARACACCRRGRRGPRRRRAGPRPGRRGNNCRAPYG